MPTFNDCCNLRENEWCFIAAAYIGCALTQKCIVIYVLGILLIRDENASALNL